MLLISFAVRSLSSRKQLFIYIYCFIYHVFNISLILITKNGLDDDVNLHKVFCKLFDFLFLNLLFYFSN